MTQKLLVTCTLNHKSGIAADAFVNTFAVVAPDGWAPATDMLNLSGPFASFYNVPTAGTKSLAHFLGYGVSRDANAHDLRVYDIAPVLGGGPHGSPIGTDRFTTQAGDNADTMPEEVALCMTLRAGGYAGQPIERADGADPGTAIDRPRSRYSGRVYLGPLTTSALSLDAAAKPRPSALLKTTILEAGVRLVQQLAANQFYLAVWSRTDAVLRQLDGPGYDPGAIQVDDAFDIQRRRGAKPLVRTSSAV